MGNIIDSLVSGFTKVIAGIVGKPLDFLSGKTCSSVCGSTWDVICYIDNFCVANLAKMAAVLFLIYLVLVLVYLIYKVGICSCVCRGMCRMVWSCVASCSSACESGCVFLCSKMRDAKRTRQERRRSRDMEGSESGSSGSESEEDSTHHRYIPRSGDVETSFSRRRRIYLQRSLRPRNHRLVLRKEPGVKVKHIHMHPIQRAALDKIKVTRTSRFVHKSSGRRAPDYRTC